jgi:hypothetical protein
MNYKNLNELCNDIDDLEPKEIYAALWQLYPNYSQQRVDDIYRELFPIG